MLRHLFNFSAQDMSMCCLARPSHVQVKYQYVRQTRVPRSLPQVLVVNTGLQDREDLAWWRPYTYTALDLQGEAVMRQRAWLPAAVAVTADPEGWTVAAQEADSAEALLAAAAQQAVPPGGQRAVYELTAVVALVRQATDCTACHGHQLAAQCCCLAKSGSLLARVLLASALAAAALLAFVRSCDLPAPQCRRHALPQCMCICVQGRG